MNGLKCPCCDSQVTIGRYLFVTKTLSNPVLMKLWLEGKWTYEMFEKEKGEEWNELKSLILGDKE